MKEGQEGRCLGRNQDGSHGYRCDNIALTIRPPPRLLRQRTAFLVGASPMATSPGNENPTMGNTFAIAGLTA